MFWWDNWCDNASLAELLDLGMTTIQNPKLRVCEVITHDKEWEIHKIRSLISQDHIIQKIIGIPLPHTEVEESFCWGFTGSEQFTMKSATWAAHKNFDFNDAKWPFNWIWKLDVMLKLRIFYGRLCLMPCLFGVCFYEEA